MPNSRKRRQLWSLVSVSAALLSGCLAGEAEIETSYETAYKLSIEIEGFVREAQSPKPSIVFTRRDADALHIQPQSYFSREARGLLAIYPFNNHFNSDPEFGVPFEGYCLQDPVALTQGDKTLIPLLIPSDTCLPAGSRGLIRMAIARDSGPTIITVEGE